MKKFQYSQYQALFLALKRDGVAVPGKVASVLLDSFLKANGYIYKNDVGDICEEGKFTLWRDHLTSLGWLQYDKAKAIADKQFALHRPGRKLIKYINREKLETKKIVTDDELEKTKLEFNSEIDALKFRVSVLETDSEKTKESMKDLYNQLNLGEIDPPDYKKSRRILEVVKSRQN